MMARCSNQDDVDKVTMAFFDKHIFRLTKVSNNIMKRLLSETHCLIKGTVVVVNSSITALYVYLRKLYCIVIPEKIQVIILHLYLRHSLFHPSFYHRWNSYRWDVFNTMGNKITFTTIPRHLLWNIGVKICFETP